MAYRRPPEGHRVITVQLPAELIAHLDRRASERTISRAAMIRQLILADRQATAAAA
jgi:metal-responsive CopG/Arc/MetJ family transcriptional regulator